MSRCSASCHAFALRGRSSGSRCTRRTAPRSGSPSSRRAAYGAEPRRLAQSRWRWPSTSRSFRSASQLERWHPARGRGGRRARLRTLRAFAQATCGTLCSGRCSAGLARRVTPREPVVLAPLAGGAVDARARSGRRECRRARLPRRRLPDARSARRAARANARADRRAASASTSSCSRDEPVDEDAHRRLCARAAAGSGALRRRARRAALRRRLVRREARSSRSPPARASSRSPSAARRRRLVDRRARQQASQVVG